MKGREITKGMYKGMSESLGLEENAIADALGFENETQLIVANLYPPCPDPEAALGLPPHSDNSSIAFLIQNGISGLQVHHNGKWVNRRRESSMANKVSYFNYFKCWDLLGRFI